MTLLRRIGLVAAMALAGWIGLQAAVRAAEGGIRTDQAEPARSGPEQLIPVQGGGLDRVRIEVGGLERRYFLYIPDSARGGPAPLVIAFHGGGQGVERFAEGVDLRGMADRYGFVMAVPEGLRESWNTGSLDPQGYAEENGIDDLAFVAALIDDVLATGAVDPARVYGMGVSRGGMMVYYAACNLPGRFAAIAAVAATLASGSCPDPGSTSLLHIHGTDDERVPFAGGTGEFTARDQSWPSAYAGIMTFAARAQCGQDWQARQVTADTLCTQVACGGGESVEYCLVDGGGHAWPGVALTARQERQGATSSALFAATDYIAAFFLSQ